MKEVNKVKNIENLKTIKVTFENHNCAYLNYKEIEPQKYDVDIILSVEGYRTMFFAHSVIFPAAINESLVRVDSIEHFEEDLMKWFGDCVSSGFFSWDGICDLVFDEADNQ